jgi:cytochrome c oxidase subunit 1
MSGDLSMAAEVPPVERLHGRRPFPLRTGPKGDLVDTLVTTTDHTMIGIMHLVACFAAFFIGGLTALFMRAELTLPGLQLSK